MDKKISLKIAVRVIAIFAIIIIASSMYIVGPNQYALVKQFGRIVDQEATPGLYFKIPMLQSVSYISTAEQLYDLAESDVITSDKKTMIADCYSTWRVTNPMKFYQTLSASTSTAESRIDIGVYNSMKNVISSTKQDDVISGKDGSLDQAIMSQINGMDTYGISIIEVEMKLLDLPEDNKNSVYQRMISERNVISAQYTAEGNQQATEINNQVDSTVRVMLSDAKTQAALLEAEGDAEYFRILAEAYNSSDYAKEFYQFIIGINSLKESLANGGTIVIDRNSPLYEVIMNVNG